MKSLASLLKVSFFIFLDISGILLGVFLTIVGLAVLFGWHVNVLVGWFLVIVGVAAFLLHLGHYLDLKYMRWLFGDDYFLQK